MGLASFTVQLGELGKGIKFDIVDARLTDDRSKTFILGMDVMSGYSQEGRRAMFPWVLDIAGKLGISLRGVGNDYYEFPMKVLEENTYNPSWDVQRKKKDKQPATAVASVFPPPPPTTKETQR